MITVSQNQNVNLYTPAFKGEPAASDRYAGVRNGMHKVEEIVIKSEEVIPKAKPEKQIKQINREAVKIALKFMGTLGMVSAGFVWNRLKNLGMALATWPFVIVMGLVLEAGLMLKISHHYRYPNGDYKYKLEQLDKNAEKAEALYEKDPDEYYQKTGKVIFDYKSALEQMKAEKNMIQTSIHNAGGNR